MAKEKWGKQKQLREQTVKTASRSAWPSTISKSSCMRSGGALSLKSVKLLRKSMNILNSAPVTSCKLCISNRLNQKNCCGRTTLWKKSENTSSSTISSKVRCLHSIYYKYECLERFNTPEENLINLKHIEFTFLMRSVMCLSISASGCSNSRFNGNTWSCIHC